MTNKQNNLKGRDRRERINYIHMNIFSVQKLQKKQAGE